MEPGAYLYLDADLDYVVGEAAKVLNQPIKSNLEDLQKRADFFFYGDEVNYQDIRNMITLIKMSAGKVFLISNLDTIGDGQNLLLKILECLPEEIYVLMMSEKGGILTVRSRSKIIRVDRRLNEKRCTELMKEEKVGEYSRKIYMAVSGSNPELLKVCISIGIPDELKDIYENPTDADIMKLLNLIREKDKGCFFDKGEIYLKMFFNLIKSICEEYIMNNYVDIKLEEMLKQKYNENIINECNKAIRNINSYSRNDFLIFVQMLVR